MALAMGTLPPSYLWGGGGIHAPSAPWPRPGSYAYASFRSEPTTYWAIKLRLYISLVPRPERRAWYTLSAHVPKCTRNPGT